MDGEKLELEKSNNQYVIKKTGEPFLVTDEILVTTNTSFDINKLLTEYSLKKCTNFENVHILRLTEDTINLFDLVVKLNESLPCGVLRVDHNIINI